MNTTGKKFGGRKKGTPNKLTANVRQTINDFINNNITDLQAVYDKLRPQEKIHYLTKLLEFTTPKLKNMEVVDVTKIENFDLNTIETLEQIHNEMHRGNTKQAEILLKTFSIQGKNNDMTEDEIDKEINRLLNERKE